MLYSNIPTRFSTNPGEGIASSRYYVFKNGTIRAKFAAQEIHVRPGKNICYIAGDVDARDSSKPDSMKLDEKEYVTYAAAMDAKGKYQTPTIGMAPVDFVLDAKGQYEGGFHLGHVISANFSAKIGDKPVDLANFDDYIMATYSDGAGNLRDHVQQADANLEGYLKWLSDNT